MTQDRSGERATGVDADIKAMFDRRAGQGDASGLRGQILAASVSVPQARGWRLRLPRTAPVGLRRVLVLALVTAAVVGLGVAGAGVLQQARPAPTGLAANFVRPFEYAIPVDSAMRSTEPPLYEVVAWAAGTDLPRPVDGSGSNPGARPLVTEARGVVVASVRAGSWSHSGSGRFEIRTAPAEFIADLRDVSGVRMGEIIETTLDGRPSLSVLLLGIGGSDIHLNAESLSGTFVFMTNPARLTVAEVDGTTVFVLSWARTPADLNEWLPVADEFVASIHFLQEGQP